MIQQDNHRMALAWLGNLVILVGHAVGTKADFAFLEATKLGPLVSSPVRDGRASCPCEFALKTTPCIG